MAPAFTDYSEFTMANTRDRRSIIPPIRFRYDLDPIDGDQSPCHPPVNNGSSTLPGSAQPVSETYFQSTDVCPSCQTSNHRKSGRYCASCGLFYHLACVRLKKAESSGLRTWLCQRCLFPEHATLSSPQPSTAPSMNQHLLDERELPMNSPNCVDNADNVLKKISQLSRFYRIPIRIPKSCRIPVAEALAEAIDLGFEYGLEQFCLFSYPRFGRTDQTKQRRFLSLFRHPCKSETTHTISFRSKHPLSAVAVSSSSQKVIAIREPPLPRQH